MTRTKEITITLDFDELDKQIEEQRDRQEELEGERPLSVRSTVFSLGKDPRVGVKRKVSTPDLRLVELLKDGIDNPYVELSWRIARFDVDSAGVTAFNIYRRRLSREEIFRETRDFKKKIRKFSRVGFDRVSRKIIRKGKFSSEKKGIYQLRRSLIPKDILNSSLDSLEKTTRSRTDFVPPFTKFSTRPRFPGVFHGSDPRSVQGRFERSFQNKKFKKIGQVDYSKFLAKDEQKFVSVTEREFVDLSFKDKEPGYGEVFEYYITSVTKGSQESPRSNIVRILIEDLSSIRPPSNFTAAQIDETKIRLKICLDPRDDIARVMIFRKSEDEISFKRIISILNVSDCINLVDSSVRYGKSYTYRAIAENIHGSLSDPKEIDVFSTVQKLTPQSKSNNLRIPILLAVQDQNSDFIKVTISSNDTRVRYYLLERRDLTIYERSFSVPSKDTTGYGGDGWETNKFFIDRSRVPTFGVQQNKDILNRSIKESEVVFIDNTVQAEHIYQYRVRGFDFFGNATPYQLSLVKAVGKKAVRSPVNVRFEQLRGSPFRIKVLWDDDNQATKFSDEDLFQGDPESLREPTRFIYKIQRRKRSETIYQSFPMTANKFLIDEVAAPDFVSFSAKRVDDTFEKIDNLQVEDTGEVLVRPFNIPEFLAENDIYYYRIAAIAENGDVSNFTEEVEISTLPELSDPTNFRVEVLNIRVRPLVARLTWGIDSSKARPDHWIIERRFDVENDTFELIGRAYATPEFFDRNLQSSNTYLYRIKSVDLLGRESGFFDAKITV